MLNWIQQKHEIHKDGGLQKDSHPIFTYYINKRQSMQKTSKNKTKPFLKLQH